MYKIPSTDSFLEILVSLVKNPQSFPKCFFLLFSDPQVLFWFCLCRFIMENPNIHYYVGSVFIFSVFQSIHDIFYVSHLYCSNDQNILSTENKNESIARRSLICCIEGEFFLLNLKLLIGIINLTVFFHCKLLMLHFWFSLSLLGVKAC